MVGDFIESGAECGDGVTLDTVSDDTPTPDAAEQTLGAKVNDGCPTIGVPESLVIDVTITAPGGQPSADVPQSCNDGVDNDADTKLDAADDDPNGCDPTTYTAGGTDSDYDGVDDADDNCPTNWNPEQTDLDGDDSGDVCDTDDDNDIHTVGIVYTDLREWYLGTDPLADCPQVSGKHDAWPMDMDKNTILNLGGDVAKYIGKLGKNVGDDNSLRRLDLDGNGLLNLGGDVAKYIGTLGVLSCTP
jgi:hypothetical protein